MTTLCPQCIQCRHFDMEKLVCRAFPERIPDPIFNNEVPHDRPYPGDSGIRFEPRPGLKRGNLIIDKISREWRKEGDEDAV